MLLGDGQEEIFYSKQPQGQNEVHMQVDLLSDFFYKKL